MCEHEQETPEQLRQRVKRVAKEFDARCLLELGHTEGCGACRFHANKGSFDGLTGNDIASMLASGISSLHGIAADIEQKTGFPMTFAVSQQLQRQAQQIVDGVALVQFVRQEKGESEDGQ